MTDRQLPRRYKLTKFGYVPSGFEILVPRYVGPLLSELTLWEIDACIKCVTIVFSKLAFIVLLSWSAISSISNKTNIARATKIVQQIFKDTFIGRPE